MRKGDDVVRWFKSDAGRWFVIGAASATLLATFTRGPYDRVTMAAAVLQVAFLLPMLASALHGRRRPWLRSCDFTEHPDGRIVVHQGADDVFIAHPVVSR